MLPLLKQIWRGWKRFTHGLVRAQSWILMAVAYIFAVGPVALFFRFFQPDPLDRGAADPKLPTYSGAPRMGAQDIRRAQRPW